VRAALVRALHEPLTVEEVDLRAPGAGEAQVRIEAASFCITDALAMGGFTFAQPPFISGHSAVGVVEAVGEGVATVEVGQRVVVAGSTECGTCYWCVRNQPAACEQIFGGMIPPRLVATDADGTEVTADGGAGVFAERNVLREVQLVAVDSDLPAEHLCMLGCGITSGLGAVLNVARVEAGSSVAIAGCGHLGLWMVQGARLAGASQIIAVDPIAERREVARELGATDLVDPGDGDPVEQVRALTEGRGADYAFEAAGTTTAMEQAVAWTRAAGTMVATGMERPDSTVTLSAIDFAISGKRFLSSQSGGGHIRRDVPRFARMLARGEIDPRPIASRLFGLDEINDAVRAARNRTVLTGVVVP
jgi:Zn-dependent alcohol dehydrogenase